MDASAALSTQLSVSTALRFEGGKLIGIDFRAENELLVSRNLLPLSQCFFYVCEGVVEDIDHVLVKCTVANQVWMVGLPELFELELWTLRGIGCLPY